MQGRTVALSLSLLTHIVNLMHSEFNFSSSNPILNTLIFNKQGSEGFWGKVRDELSYLKHVSTD